MTQIKFNAGDIVFWLSSRGFCKGWIKTVSFQQEKGSDSKIRTTLKYFLTNENSVYQGDEVEESRIFTTQKEMVEYYSKKKL